MKVLGGVVQPDEGQILIDGKPTVFDSVKKSVESGIGFIHQELNPLDNLDIAGNVYLGREPLKYGMLDRAKMRAGAQVVIDQLGLDVSADTSLSRLSLAQCQMVEIAKALSLNARVLIMDEPTSSLTLTETERLLQVVRDLKARGVGIIYISHRLGEVMEIGDRVVALRDGQNAGGLAKEEITHDSMVRMMVGRSLSRSAETRSQTEGPVRLKVNGLKTLRYPDKEISFEVRQGEIFCLAGLVGAGRSEVVQTIFGTDQALGGSVFLDDKQVPLNSPKAAIDAGIGLVPEDRRKTGLLVDWSIKDNITLPSLWKFAKSGLVSRREETVAADEQSKAIGVKAPSTAVAAANLSGGNQQKVVVAKWLMRQPKVLILDEPTRGVDVGAKAEIYDLMRKLTEQGVAILMVSSDMEEVLGVSDRVGVMHEGSVSGILPREGCTEEKIMRLAVGRTEV